MTDSLNDPNGRPQPAAGPVRSRRRWRGPIAVITALAALGAVALIMTGLQGPSPAPLPERVFSMPAGSVPDPVTGPMPTIGHLPARNGQPTAPARHPGVPAPGQPRPPAAGAAAGPGGGGASDPGAAAGFDVTAPGGPPGADPGPGAGASPGAGGGGNDGSAPRRQIPADPLTDNTLLVPSVGIDAAMTVTGIEHGELTVPTEVSTVTDWDGSAPLAATTGTVLVAGHIDNIDQGEGAMYPLHLVQPGDAAYVTRDGVVSRWKIVALQSIPKSQLPASLFVGASGPRQLKLVTCGGTIANGSYDDNVVATAVPF